MLSEDEIKALAAEMESSFVKRKASLSSKSKGEDGNPAPVFDFQPSSFAVVVKARP